MENRVREAPTKALIKQWSEEGRVPHTVHIWGTLAK